MDRKLLDYLPPVLREVTDFKAINHANEPEISLAWDALDMVLANQFLETADAHGVSAWEKELKIFPRDTDTLAGRKARIKAMWNLETPYTIPWLRRWINGLGGVIHHRESLDGYTLRLELDYDATGIDCVELDAFIREIYTMLLHIRPANILIDLTKITVAELGAGSIRVKAGLGPCISKTELPEREAPYKNIAAQVSAGMQGCVSILQPPERAPEFRGQSPAAAGFLKSSLAITALPEIRREETE